MVNSKAWLEGKRAGSEGIPESKNPYRGGQDMQSWFDGWKAGRNDLQKSG
ncbi:ribosome modulation factor [Sphingobium chungangianum]